MTIKTNITTKKFPENSSHDALRYFNAILFILFCIAGSMIPLYAIASRANAIIEINEANENPDSPVQPGIIIPVKDTGGKNAPVDWNNKIFAIGTGFGFFDWQPQFADKSLFPIYGAEFILGLPMDNSLELKYWFTKNFQLSLGIYSQYWITISSPRVGGWNQHVMLFTAYRLPIHRWSFYAEAGAGYGSLSVEVARSTFPLPGGQIMMNPVFGAGLGFDFLIFNFLSAGLNSRVYMVYDYPTPLIDVRIRTVINFIFGK